MAMTVSELQVKVSADTREAESGLSALGGKIASIGGGLATAFGTAAVAGIAAVGGALVASTAAAAGFDQTMASVRSKLSNAEWEAQGAAIQATAMRLGRDYPLSASEAGKAIDLLLQKGVSAQAVNEGWAESVVKLSTATGSDLVTSAEIAAAASDAFGISADKSGEVVNKVTGAVLKGGMSINDYGLAAKAAAGVVALAGGSIDDLNLGLATMARRGIEGSDAGTSLKTMYMNLIPTTKQQIAVAKELGLVTADGSSRFFDATGKVKSYAEISTILAEATAGLTQEQKLMALETLFGSDAIRAAGIAAEYGKGEIHELSAEINAVDAGDVAAKRMDNLKGSIDQLGGSLETAGIAIGLKFTPGLKSIVDGATEIVNEATPQLEAFASSAASAIQEASRQIQDAWRTAKQAFAGEWLPSDDIPPFVNEVGKAATKLGELATFLQKVSDKAGQMGAWDSFGAGLETLSVNLDLVIDRTNEIGASLGRLNAAAGSTETKVNVLAAGVKAVGVAFELWAVSIGQAIDNTMSFVNVGIEFVSMLANMGRAVVALATGDVPGYEAAMQGAAQSLAALVLQSAQFADRSAASVAQGFAAMTGSAQAELPNVTAAVVSMAQQSVAAVEAAAPAAAAAAGEMGTGMAGGIEQAAPQMVAAADAGASGAVNAVAGQTGAASSAGQSLGAALGSGLEGGIMAYVGRVAAAAANLVSAAIGAANAEAEVRSPSKKTEKLGEQMAEGLEIGLNKSDLGEDMKRKIRDFIDASRDYIPVAGQIAQVERRIKEIRDEAQTAALFRAQEMITIDSHALELKRQQVNAERDLLPLRQDLARATREVTEIERGSLADRTRLIEMDGERKALRLQEIELEKELLGLDPDSKKAKRIKEQIDALRIQSRELDLEAEKTRLTQDVAATSARVKREGLDDQVRRQQAAIDAIKDEIDVLGAEQAVFQANENVIKNATENEIAYRNRLIAVFTAEGKPLADRITAGLALVDQLEKEGRISKELADKLRAVGKEATDGKGATQALGTAAATAAPQLGTAAQKAGEMAAQAQAVAEQAKAAASKVDALSSALGRLPSWFRPTGSGGGGGLFQFQSQSSGEASRSGGEVPALLGATSAHGGGGGHQTITLDIAINGRVAEQIYVEGRELAIRRGRSS